MALAESATAEQGKVDESIEHQRLDQRQVGRLRAAIGEYRPQAEAVVDLRVAGANAGKQGVDRGMEGGGDGRVL